MNYEARKWHMWKEAWSATFMTALAVFVFGGPLFGLITWLFNPPWTERSVVAFIAVVGVLPIALVFSTSVRKIVRLHPDDNCNVCNRELAECECCPECLGDATTGYLLRMEENALLPNFCIHCHGTGKEGAQPETPLDTCTFCGKAQYGKSFVVHQVMRTQSMTHYEFRYHKSEAVYLCCECSEGCRDLDSAESAAAHRMTARLTDTDRESKLLEYIGDASWKAMPDSSKNS